MSTATTGTITLTALPGIKLVQAGDDLGALVAAALDRAGLRLVAGDVLVVAQKIVSKAEGRMVELDGVTPSPEAIALAGEIDKDPRLVHLILSESRRVVRARPGLLIMEHRLGFVMANAGVDQSNVAAADGRPRALLLPEDPDASARRIRARIAALTGTEIGVIVNDSFGRPFRNGTCGVAIGVAGLEALTDLRGRPDLFGRRLEVSVVGHADEIAAAASLVMGQAGEGQPLVLVRGLAARPDDLGVRPLLRNAAEDLFR